MNLRSIEDVYDYFDEKKQMIEEEDDKERKKLAKKIDEWDAEVLSVFEMKTKLKDNFMSSLEDLVETDEPSDDKVVWKRVCNGWTFLFLICLPLIAWIPCWERERDNVDGVCAEGWDWWIIVWNWVNLTFLLDSI
eukprot:UN28764